MTTVGGELAAFLNSMCPEVRKAMLAEFDGHPELYNRNYYWSIQEYRRQVVKRLQRITSLKFASVRDYDRDALRFQTFLRTIGFVDYSTSIKAGVHFTLCGGSIISLGTEYHYQFLDKMDSLEIFGCLSMTELGHGSNVSDIETTAHFDSTTDEFIIHTPTETAQKFWIGGAAEDARITVTFAQLNVDGKNQGVHAFLVELRDASGNLKPGVRIKDNGPKLGLNGVDNGRIWFNNVRIPRANLLDKYCKVSPDGKYSSPIKNSSVRFATMISGLVGGRILIAGSALDACKVGLVNAIRYSLQRKQFGPSSGIEIPIMNYITHQRRLIPALATTYVIELSITKCARMFHSRTPSLMKEIHLLAAGLKAFSTWHRVETVQKCRQVVGGQGFSSYNKIAELIADYDVDTTFEGDNTVLTQQVTKALLAQVAERVKSGVEPFPHVEVPDFDLADTKWLLKSLEKRARDKLLHLSHGIETSMRNGLSPYEAYNSMLDVGVAAALSHIEHSILEHFINEINSQKLSADSRNVLIKVAKLYGFDRIERDLGFFASERLISKNQIESIRKTVNALCNDVVSSGDIELLMQGFDLPNISLGPIANNFVEALSYHSKL